MIEYVSRKGAKPQRFPNPLNLAPLRLCVRFQTVLASRRRDKTSLIADPMFVDWKNDDFRLKPESPAFKLGFEAIPVKKIGVRFSE